MQKKNTTVNPYLKTKIMTASPQELQLMLYEGAIRFAQSAIEKIDAGAVEQGYVNIKKAERIVVELISGLRRDVHPSLCDQLANIYNFLYKKLLHANLKRSTEDLHDVIRVLSVLSDIWKELIAKLAREEDNTIHRASTQKAQISLTG